MNKGVSVISDDSISKNDLFNEFNYAITFNSAVIHDLFIYDKPFFIIDYKYDNFFNIDVTLIVINIYYLRIIILLIILQIIGGGLNI